VVLNDLRVSVPKGPSLKICKLIINLRVYNISNPAVITIIGLVKFFKARFFPIYTLN